MAGYDYGEASGRDWDHGQSLGSDDPYYDHDPSNLGPPTPSRHNGPPHGSQSGKPPPISPALSGADHPDAESRRSGERNRSRPRPSRSASGQVRTCQKCGEVLTLDGTFHLDCFRCRVSFWTMDPAPPCASSLF
jgi:hypothetical protein